MNKRVFCLVFFLIFISLGFFSSVEIEESFYFEDFFNSSFEDSHSDLNEDSEGYLIEFNFEPLLERSTKKSSSGNFGILSLSDSVSPKKEHQKAISDISSLLVEDSSNSIFNFALPFFRMLGWSILSPNENKLSVDKSYFASFNGIYTSSNLSEEDLRKIESSPYVKRVSPNYFVHANLEESVPLIQDGVLAGQLDRNGNDCLVSGEECLTGRGVKIAIIDSGVDYTHPDLGGCFGESCKVVGGYDFVNEDNDPIDDHGHGTHCAAIAAGNGTLKGVAPGAEIYSFKVLNSSGYGTWEKIISSIEMSYDLNRDGCFWIGPENVGINSNGEECVEEGGIEDRVDIISMSLGSTGGNPEDIVSMAVDRAVDFGIVAVISAGNSGSYLETIGSPGTSKNAITVGASDKLNSLASFSSRGPVIWVNESGVQKGILKPDVLAPGVSICAARSSTNPWSDRVCKDSSHVFLDGTSMAAPHVTGIVALMKEKNSSWTPEEIKNSLKATSKDLGYLSIEQGAGLVNVSNFISLSLPVEISFEDFFLYSDKLLYSTNKEMIISGFFSEGFSPMDLFWRKKGGEEWSNQGITLIGENSTFGKFNPEGNILERGFYEFNGSVFDGENKYESIIEVYFDDRLKLSFGSEFFLGKKHEFAPKIFTFNDSNFFVGVRSDGGSVYNVLGEAVLNFSGRSSFSTGPFFTAPSIGDIFGDNGSEISFVKIGNRVSLVDIVNDKETVLSFSEGSFSNSNIKNLLFDLNGDGKKDILTQYDFDNCSFFDFVTFDGERLSSLAGWPKKFCVEEGVIYPIDCAIGDLDNNEEIEVVCATIYRYSGEEYYTPAIYIFDAFGRIINNFSIQRFSPDRPVSFDASEIILADINLDGILEMGVTFRGGYERTLFLNSSGDILEGWPYDYEKYSSFYNNHHSFILSDLDKNGSPEIISWKYSSIGRGTMISVLNSSGDILEGWPIWVDYGGTMIQPITFDINGDGLNEIIFPFGGDWSNFNSDRKILVFNMSGSEVDSFFIDPSANIFASPSLTVGDFFGNGKASLVVFDHPFTNFRNSDNIFVFELDVPFVSSKEDWTMWGYDLGNTKCYNCNLSGKFISQKYSSLEGYLNNFSSLKNISSNISFVIKNTGNALTSDAFYEIYSQKGNCLDYSSCTNLSLISRGDFDLESFSELEKEVEIVSLEEGNFTYVLFVNSSNNMNFNSYSISYGYVEPSFSFINSSNKEFAFDLNESDSFGKSVSISGNYSIVGAMNDDDLGEDSGSAYIYKKNSTGQFEFVNKLLAFNGGVSHRFGSSVSISEDYAIVGAPSAFIFGNRSGSAYIYKKNSTDGKFDFVNMVFPSISSPDLQFGVSVSISGNYSIVGARTDNEVGENTGSVYVFKKNSTGQFEFLTKISESSLPSGSYFGSSVDFYEDYLVVGVIFDNPLGKKSGSVYIYKKNSTDQFEFVNKVFDPLGKEADYFGNSVSIYENYLIVGAYMRSESSPNCGVAYIYKKNSTGQFEFLNKVVADDSFSSNYFGSSVSIFNDYVLVGAEGNNASTGAVYIYRKNSTGYFEQAFIYKKNSTGQFEKKSRIFSKNPLSQARFGNALDSFENSFIVGSYLDSDQVYRAGSVSIFEISFSSLEDFSIENPEDFFCGDGTCNGGETCATCSIDCGSCDGGSSDSPGGSSTSGGSSPSGIVQNTEECVSNWTNCYWTECKDNRSSFLCFDVNYCEDITSKTFDTKSCEHIGDNSNFESENDSSLGEDVYLIEKKKSFYNFILYFVLAIFIILLIAIVFLVFYLFRKNSFNNKKDSLVKIMNSSLYQYLSNNINKYSLDSLKRKALSEGYSEKEFNEIVKILKGN